ncbi:MAG: DUF3006 domain-containing protein [Tissierellia bacterium]|nr:DUF3006 domain-containing protein [Tissierellia bacterium]
MKDNEDCYSSKGIATEQEINKSLVELENLIMNGLYVLDDDVLGMLLQIKIYIVNLNMFSGILRGYYDNKENYRKIKTRQRLQSKALDKTILRNKFPQLIHALASLCSAYFQESEEQRDNTLKGFFAYAVDILEWQEGLSGITSIDLVISAHPHEDYIEFTMKAVIDRFEGEYAVVLIGTEEIKIDVPIKNPKGQKTGFGLG